VCTLALPFLTKILISMFTSCFFVYSLLHLPLVCTQYANENDTAPLYPQDAATCGTWVKQFDQCPGGQVVLGLTLAEFILLFIVLPVAVVAAVTVTLCICMRKKIRNLRNMSTVQFTSTLSPLSSPRTDVPTPQTMPLLHSKRRTPF